MNKILLALSISIMVFATGANGELKGYQENNYWAPLGSDGVEADYYINLNSIKRSGYKKHLAAVWFMHGRNLPDLQQKMKMKSIKEHLLIDCNNYKVLRQYAIFYEGNMGEGDINVSISPETEWYLAPRGSGYNLALELVCKVIKERKK